MKLGFFSAFSLVMCVCSCSSSSPSSAPFVPVATVTPTPGAQADGQLPLPGKGSATPVPSAAPSQPLPVGKALLKGEIVLSDVLGLSSWQLKQSQLRQFGVRVLMRSCDELLAAIDTTGVFNIANLPENVPLDVDIYDKNNPRLQLRAQVTLLSAETSLKIDVASTALALLRVHLAQAQSQAAAIPELNYSKDADLAKVLEQLVVVLSRLLGEETLRSLRYQLDWNTSLAIAQQTLETMVNARPELLSLLEPLPSATPSVAASASSSPVATGGSSGGGSGGGGSSSQESLSGSVSLEGL